MDEKTQFFMKLCQPIIPFYGVARYHLYFNFFVRSRDVFIGVKSNKYTDSVKTCKTTFLLHMMEGFEGFEGVLSSLGDCMSDES